jgi:hypothetical protein
MTLKNGLTVKKDSLIKDNDGQTKEDRKPDEQDEYVFVEKSGRAFLPERAKGYIIVMGDKQDSS